MNINELSQYSQITNLAYVKWGLKDIAIQETMIDAANAARRISGKQMI